jgi:hypothetical protein
MVAIAGLVLGLVSAGTFHCISAFPSAAPVEQILAAVSSFTTFALAAGLGIAAIANETKRTQFKYVVERYTKVTGDTRYVPYILPVRTSLVTSLFVVSMAVSFVLPFISIIMGAVKWI